jgi:hypothetical protein
MPIKFIRLLIAFTLALAIPLQGVASVTAGVCMAIGHHEAGTPDSHEHGHDSDHSAPHEDDSATSHCAPCVACCAAASISPARQVYLPHDSPPAAIAALPFLPPGFLPENLDRPPLGL